MRNSMKPTAGPEVSALIDALGGPTEVSRIVTAHFNIHTPMTPQAICNWKRRGIPWAYRACLAMHARDQSIDVPENFMNEGFLPAHVARQRAEQSVQHARRGVDPGEGDEIAWL